MAKIKSTVDALAAEYLKPVKPEDPEKTAPPESAELSASKIQSIVNRIVKPWHYGNNLCRFAREENVTLKQVREIKAAVDDRLRAIAPVLVVEPEIVKGDK